MSRTEQLRHGGGRERGGSGGGAPFVKWGDDYAWFEGRVVSTFETKYGLAAVMEISDVGGGTLRAEGKDEDGEDTSTTVTPGTEVAIGTQSATLQGKIEQGDVGKHFHVAFEGWEQGKQNKYRVFTVIELTEPGERSTPRDEPQEVGSRAGGAGPGAPGSNMFEGGPDEPLF